MQKVGIGFIRFFLQFVWPKELLIIKYCLQDRPAFNQNKAMNFL